MGGGECKIDRVKQESVEGGGGGGKIDRVKQERVEGGGVVRLTE